MPRSSRTTGGLREQLPLQMLRVQSADYPEAAQGLSLPAPEHALRIPRPEKLLLLMGECRMPEVPAPLPGEPGASGMPGMQKEALQDTACPYFRRPRGMTKKQMTISDRNTPAQVRVSSPGLRR